MKQVEIIDYEPKYRNAFRDMNEEWIKKYFKMEDKDYQSLNDPQKYIIDEGGYILVALYDGDPVGVCGLLKAHNPEYDNELAKMAVRPKVQGLGIGWKLGSAAVERAKQLGAKKIFLESNTVLVRAIKLYEKLGFRKIEGWQSPYERCNIIMELNCLTRKSR